MRNIKEMEEFSVVGANINNLRYADDTIIIADSEQKLQNLRDVIVDESGNKGLDINKENIICNGIFQEIRKPEL